MRAMASPRPIHAGPKTFDDAKLQNMVEPLTVRIIRLSHGKGMPIPMWASDSGLEDGAGFTKDEIRGLDTYLVTQWAGGGLYEISVTDSSENPITMRWQPWWDLNAYPELVPPPLQGARSPDAAPAQPAPAQPMGSRMPPFIQPQPFTAWSQPSGYPMPPPPQVGTQQYDNWTREAERRERDAEVKRLREEADRRDREAAERERKAGLEAAEARHKAEIERERMANNERFARLESMFTSLTTNLKEANATPKGPSPELLAMQTQVAALTEAARKADDRADAARREQEADRRETLLRDQMRQQADEAKRQFEATQRQIETMQQQFQTTISNLTTQMANASNKSDPMLQFMQENARTHAEALKEVARENRAAIERMQAFMMNPAELIRLAREGQDGIEKAMDRATRFTDNIVGMQQKVLENALSMQPQNNGVIDAVTQGMTNVKEFLERFVSGKSKEAIAAAQSQVEVARAQAHAVEVHARASNPAAFMPPPGLAGPSEVQHVQEFTPPPPPADSVKPARVERLWGRTDEEWFGPALSEVMELRAGVIEFLVAVAELNRNGKAPDSIEKIPGTHPADAARGISMGMTIAQQRGIVVPAMIELLMAGNVNEFIAVLLPDATQEYRAELLKALQEGPSSADDEDEAEDQDDVVAPPAPQRQRNGRSRPRA